MTEKQLEPDDNGYYGPSKSQVKRDMHALQDLGKQLIDLSNEKLNKLSLNDNLLTAIKEAQNSTAREGKRRLYQYIGKLMRFEDADRIRHQLDIWENGSKQQAKAMHRIEALRDVLLRDDNALTQFFDEFPQIDPQHFRTLVRGARREAQQNDALTEGKEPVRKHYKQLFQAIKTIVEQAEKA